MKVKEITVEVKKSKNFQTYSCSESITIDLGDDVEKVRQEAFKRCHDECIRQIELEFPPKAKPQVIPPSKPTIIKG